MKLARTFVPALVAGLFLTTPLLAAPHGFLGVYLTEEAESTDGALIEEVAPDTPAEASGLRKGDRVVRCDDTPTPHSMALIKLLVSSRPGQVLTLRVARDGWEKTVKVTLGRPAAEPAPPAPPGPAAAKERGFLGIYLRQGSEGEPIIDGVMQGTPAAEAGLRVGDRVHSVDGKAVADPSALIAEMGRHGPGETVKVKLTRDGKDLEVAVTLGHRSATRQTPPSQARPVEPKPTPQPAERRKPYIGIALVDQDGKGPLRVDDVQANSPAERFGVRPGDVVISVDGKAVSSIEEFVKAMDGRFAGEQVVFKVERDGWRSDVRVTLGAHDD